MHESRCNRRSEALHVHRSRREWRHRRWYICRTTDVESETDAGRVPPNQHPAFWAVRQYPPLYELFRGLLGTPFLWVTVDEGVHDPAGAPGRHDGDWSLGWRFDPRSDGRHLQGMVLLSDARSDPGAFRCVPHIYRNPGPWCSIHGVGPIAASRIREEEVLSVRGAAGSLVIWDARLPCGRSPNETGADRYGMFVTMHREADEARRRERVHNFDDGLPPAWDRAMPGQPAPESFARPVLTELGERLLGRENW